MIQWITAHAWWLTAASMLLFVAGLGVALLLIVQMPADYFTRQDTGTAHRQHPLLRVVLKAAKNLGGAALLLLGIIMALPMVPGPGLLFILIGVSMLDVPGKRGLERYILSRPAVLGPVNALRAKWNRLPLQMPATRHALTQPPAATTARIGRVHVQQARSANGHRA